MPRILAPIAAFALSLTACQASQSVSRGDSRDVMMLEAPNGRVLVYAVPPPSAEYRLVSDFLVARVAEQTGEPQIAAARYASVASQVPADTQIAERAIFAALLSGDYETARQVAVSAEGLVRYEGSLVRLVLGVEALKADDTEGALEYLRGGNLAPFNRIIAQGMGAWAALDADGIEDAKRMAYGAASGDPLFDGVTSYLIGFLELASGDEEGALATFDAVWSSGVRLAIGAEAHARLLASRGEIPEALAIIRSFRDSVGPNPAIEALAAEIAAGDGVSPSAFDVREGAAMAIYGPTAALASLTGDDQAGIYFTLVLELDPDFHAARTLWGDTLDRALRFDDAAAALGAVPADSAFYANARAQLAWVYRRMGQNDAAIATAQDALKFRPDRDLKVQLGDLFRSVGDYTSAEGVFDEIVQADITAQAEDWRLFYARGAARERLGRWNDAEADLRTAMRLRPDQPDVLNYLGYSLVDRGLKLDEGFRLIKRAVALRPDSGPIVDSLGWAYFRLGRYDKAVEALERAVVLAPGDPTINDHLGDAYWKVGRRLEAKFQWQRALSLGPDDEAAAIITTKVETGMLPSPVRRADTEAAGAAGALQP